MPGYQYGGTKRDAHLPWPEPPPKPAKTPKPPKVDRKPGRPRQERRPCGTTEAYATHMYHREPVDDACRQAHKDDMREWRARRKEKQ